MSIPKEPRQLMINLMYLVLTALLALNVSSEILNAFRIVNNSILRSNESIEGKTTNAMKNFDSALEDDKVKTNPAKLKKIQDAKTQAEQAQTITKSVIGILDGYIKRIEDGAGGYIEEGGVQKLKKESDLDVATYMMVEQKEGDKLKDILNKFKDDITGVLPDSLDEERKTFKDGIPINTDDLKTKDGVKSWAFANFHSVPAVAAITILNKYKNDVKNTESAIIDKLFTLAYKEQKSQQLIFDSYAALVAAENGYIMQGQTYEAKIMLGAFSKKVNNLSITVGGQNLPVVDGVATYKVQASGLGEKSYSGKATFVNPNTGQSETYDVKGSYMVGAPSAAVSADKMNVFYIGVDNPVSVSASGVPASSVSASISGGGGSMSPGGAGKYTVRVSSVGEANINVSANVDGKQTNMGSFPFRVRKIPDPIPKVANKSGGNIQSGTWKAQRGVMAILENFEFDAKFEVVGFRLGYTPKRGDYIEASNPGAIFQGQAAEFMSRAKPGDQFYIDDIKAKGPDGTVRTLPTISFKIL